MMDAEANRGERNPMIALLAREFEFKVPFDFSRFVFLAPRDGNNSINLDKIIERAIISTGYEAHRLVFYSGYVSHIHIRYNDEANADEALCNFRQIPFLVAEKDSDLLKSIYTIENSHNNLPAWTLAIVDIIGGEHPPHLLYKDAVSDLLYEFGDPRIVSYQFCKDRTNHVQVLFSSMTEALSASIAHGNWVCGSEFECNRIPYRVRLIGSEKECEVLKRCGSLGKDKCDAFGLDYFVDCFLEDVPPPIQRLPSYNINLDGQVPTEIESSNRNPKKHCIRSRNHTGPSNYN